MLSVVAKGHGVETSKMHNYWVYILTNLSNNVFYIGMTNDLLRRVTEHKEGAFEGFTQKYRLNRLVYYEHSTEVESVILREKQIKGWRREKKIQLIEEMNSDWNDLYGDLLE